MMRIIWNFIICISWYCLIFYVRIYLRIVWLIYCFIIIVCMWNLSLFRICLMYIVGWMIIILYSSRIICCIFSIIIWIKIIRFIWGYIVSNRIYNSINVIYKRVISSYIFIFRRYWIWVFIFNWLNFIFGDNFFRLCYLYFIFKRVFRVWIWNWRFFFFVGLFWCGFDLFCIFIVVEFVVGFVIFIFILLVLYFGDFLLFKW